MIFDLHIHVCCSPTKIVFPWGQSNQSNQQVLVKVVLRQATTETTIDFVPFLSIGNFTLGGGGTKYGSFPRWKSFKIILPTVFTSASPPCKGKESTYGWLWLFHGAVQFLREASFIRELTVRQRRHPWKRPWKIDSASFQTISRSSKSPSYLKEGSLCWSWSRASVQTQRVEFIALPFPSSKQIKIWSFHVAVMQRRLRNENYSVMHVQSCYFAN